MYLILHKKKTQCESTEGYYSIFSPCLLYVAQFLSDTTRDVIVYKIDNLPQITHVDIKEVGGT